jgi:hypothetical protein
MKTKTEISLLIGGIILAAFVDARAQPKITKQPTGQSVSLGATVKFQVSATSTNPPILFQWQFASTSLPTATNASLTLTNIHVINAGGYVAVLTDGSGSVTSRLAVLDVDLAFTKITAGSIVAQPGTGLAPAWGDYDNDGFLDLVVPSARDNLNSSGHKIRLFHNNGDESFTEVTNSPITLEARDWRGCSWGDYDNDGYLDLIVVSTDGDGPPAQNELFRNNGDGTFKKLTATEAGPVVSAGGISEGPVWADYDRDRFLDLFITKFRASGDSRISRTNSLYRNNGDGSFSYVPNSTAGLLTAPSENYMAMWGDYNNDGWPDLLLPNVIYRNRGNGTFEAIAPSSIGLQAFSQDGGGVWVDYNSDGYLDVLVGPADRNFLFRNNGDGTFMKIGPEAGPIVTDVGVLGGLTWGDYDNDGYIDLFVANFNPAPGANFLYHNNGDGSFSRVLTGSIANDADAPATNGSWGDLDNDGFLDLFVSRGGVVAPATNLLYRNNGNSNAWIKVRCVGTVSNRSAIGAKVRVKAFIHGKSLSQVREISSGMGFGQGPLEAHFGLGDATNVEALRIEWPSGIVQEFRNVAAKQFLTVTEPARLLAAPSDGMPQFTLQGGRAMQYEIQVSTNLNTWALLNTIMITNVNGTSLIADTNALNAAGRFYRAVLH